MGARFPRFPGDPSGPARVLTDWGRRGPVFLQAVQLHGRRKQGPVGAFLCGFCLEREIPHEFQGFYPLALFRFGAFLPVLDESHG